MGNPKINSERILSKQEYHDYLAKLDVAKLYKTITHVMKSSETCWPADGPQDNDVASYAGLFGRLAWHCSGTLRLDGNKHASGGCEGGRIRFWPEAEWRDNDNLDKARAILAKVKNMPEFRDLSWGGKLHLHYASSQHTHARLAQPDTHTHTHTHTQISIPLRVRWVYMQVAARQRNFASDALMLPPAALPPHSASRA